MTDEPRELSAGPLHVLLAGGDLRYLTVMRDEVVRRIYVTVRDAQWGTVEPAVSNLAVTQDDDDGGFHVEYDAEHRRGEIDFFYHATIDARWELSGATARMEVSFEMDGVARSTFRTNRTGFCVLHPPPPSEDTVPVYLIKHSGEKRTRAKPPFLVSPSQPFTDIRSITHWPWPGTTLSVTVNLDGDMFEMEDQRNWADASYKTYCRPLSQPFPYTLKKGQKVRQAVTVEVVARNWRKGKQHRRVVPGHDRAAGVNVLAPAVGSALGMGKLPAIGVARGPCNEELSQRDRDRLRDLNLSHLRLDLSEGESATDVSPGALHCIADAKALGVPLEVALHVKAGAAGAGACKLAKRVAPLLREADVARFVVYQMGRPMASTEAVAAAVRDLRPLFPKVPVGAGTVGNFAELNRNQPAGPVELLAWPLNPQMHAGDNLSLMENLAAQCDTVRSAREFAPGAKLAVGPVTLHRRPDPFAAGKSGGAGELVAPDPRQRDDFCAAWTLGSIKFLAEAGADSVTYYQATGPFGLMDEEELFPLYHVLADVGEFAGGEVLATDTTEPRWLAALTLRKDDRLRVLVANLFWHDQPVRLAKVKGYVPLVATKPLLEDVLPPYGVARFDFISEEEA